MNDDSDDNRVVIDRLLEEIREDFDYKGDDNLRKKYEALSRQERRAVNDIFTAICGWNLCTLLAAEKDEDLNDVAGRRGDADTAGGQLRELMKRAAGSA